MVTTCCILKPEVGVPLKLGGSSGVSGVPTFKEAPTIIHSYSAMCDFVADGPLLTLRVRTIYIQDDTRASDELQLHTGVQFRVRNTRDSFREILSCLIIVRLR